MVETPQAPSPPTLVAPTSWSCIDFISDLHLASDTPRAFAAWADYLRNTPADAVVILGDLFEAWVGDDAAADGFEAECAAVLTAAAADRAIAHMVGNRDFLVGMAFLDRCGVTSLVDPTVLEAFGGRVLLSHGDALCLGDVAYQRFRELVRGASWQANFLAQPLETRRAVARELRAGSERRKAGADPWVDIDHAAALDLMRQARTPTLIHGHTHRPADERLAPGCRRLVLSDWELDHAAAPRAEVLRWQPSGFERLSPLAAVQTR